jgi:glycosyltransferase involved in cell wall biosynthesis
MIVNLPVRVRPDVVDFHNIEAKLMASRTDEWSLPARLAVEPEIRRLARLERRVARAAKLATACSEDDVRELRSFGARALVVPNGVSAMPPTFVPAPGKGEVAFVGSMDYAPNREALGWLFSQVWPLVQALRPEATLVVAGRNAGTIKDTVPDGLRVVVVDSPPSIDEIYRRSDVCIVPLQSGAGTKIKLLEALAHGRGVVSTSVGLEGLDEVEQWVRRADEADEFAQAIADLLDDAADRDESETFEYARSTFSWPSRLSTLLRHLESEHQRGIR